MTSLAHYFEPEEIELLRKKIPDIREGRIKVNGLDLFRKIIKNMFFELYDETSNSLFRNKMDVEDSFFELLRNLLKPVLTKRHKLIQNTRKSVVARAIEYLSEDTINDVTVPELALACFSSNRTLIYAFNTILGCSPKSYLRLRKMHTIRKALYTREFITIRELLVDFNVSNQARFSQEYRQLFGESPKETQKRIF
jgi:AraC-like DNA-binding protein